MRFDQLEPLPWANINVLLACLMVGGIILMIASFFLLRKEGGPKTVERLGGASLIVGILLMLSPVTASPIIKVLPAGDTVNHNASALQSWAESEYGVSIEDGPSLFIAKELRNEGSKTRTFPVQGPEGERRVWIEIVNGELQMTSPSEIAKVSD